MDNQERDGSPSDAPASSLLGLVNVVLKRRALIVWPTVAIELILLIVALQRPLEYTAVVAFMPEGQRPASGVTGLAAQFGLSVPGADGLSAPLFYPELVRSPQFLAEISDSQYALLPSSSDRRSLADIYGIPDGDPRVRRALAAARLSRKLNVGAAPRTGIVTVGVTAQTPELARAIADQILTGITRFNQHSRQGRAGAEKRFVERRLAEVRDSLSAAEDRLKTFLQENRDFDKSTTLAFQHARLERAVNAQQQLLSTLAPSYEQAKIEEVRDTPVLTILRRPEAPVYADPRGRVRLLAMGIFAGLAVGVALVLGLEWWRYVGTSRDPEAHEFSQLSRGLWDSLRKGQVLKAVFGARPR